MSQESGERPRHLLSGAEVRKPTDSVVARPLPHRRFVAWATRWLRQSRDGEEVYLFALAVLVGLSMGAVCALFRHLIAVTHHFFFEAPMIHAGHGIGPVAAASIGIAIKALLPAFGGLVVGLVIYRILGLVGGHGVPNVIKAIATGNVNLPPSMALKSASSIVTISTGGSSGPEGPIVEIGSVVGSLIGREALVSKERVGTLIGCGAASGIAGVFNAPIGGVFLALELLMKDFAVRTFGPIVVAAVVASVTSEAILPNSPVFPGIDPRLMDGIVKSYAQIMMFAGLGVLCGLGGSLLVYTIYKFHDLFGTVRAPMWLKPALGGLCVGVIGLAFPEVIGEGYEAVRKQILGAYGAVEAPAPTLLAALFFLFIALIKILATGLTLGSGGTGGAFAPAMVVGALLGAGFGVLCSHAAPELAPSVIVFALVGMAGTVSTTLSIPIAAILIIYEVSGANYRMVLPLMITVATASLVSSAVRQGSVYTLSLLRDGFDVEEAHRRSNDPLARLPIRRVMKSHFTRLSPGDSLDQVIAAFSTSEDDAFAVVDAEDNLVGMVSTKDIRGVMTLAGVGGAIIASDAADANPQVLYPDSMASEALAIFSSTEAVGIPVLAKAGSRRIVGMVNRVDILNTYRTSNPKADGAQQELPLGD